MKMASSAISDLWLFIRRRDLFPGVNGVRRLQFSRYGPSDLASPDQFWRFSRGCREEHYPYKIYPDCYVEDNGDSCCRLPGDIDQIVRLLFPAILVMVLLPMFIDYFNSYARARSLSIASQIMGEPLLIFTGLWFDIYLWLTSEK
jgi:hypothetical protein